jgi:hypothetical protein
MHDCPLESIILLLSWFQTFMTLFEAIGKLMGGKGNIPEAMHGENITL